MKLLVYLLLIAGIYIGVTVVVNYYTFEYAGICPSTLARVHFEKEKLFNVLEGEQGRHLGTEIRDVLIAIEDKVCPLLGR